MSHENSASKTKVCKHLTHNQFIEIRTLRRFGLTTQNIANELGFTSRKVQRACAPEDENPTSRKRRQPILSTEQVDELEAFIRESPETRQMNYLELAMGTFSHWGCRERLISNALKKRGYSRCIARNKPPSSVVNKQKRLEFAQLHLDWSEEQWSQILWTDETWVSGDSHMKPRVTRKVRMNSIKIFLILIAKRSLKVSLTRPVLWRVMLMGTAGCFGDHFMDQGKAHS